jgi:hypothetical protein
MGLSAFAGREIEFETHKLTLPTLIDKVDGLTGYLVEHGLVVKDGDTFGRDSRERFSARYMGSDRFEGLPVLFLYRWFVMIDCNDMRGELRASHSG